MQPQLIFRERLSIQIGDLFLHTSSWSSSLSEVWNVWHRFFPYTIWRKTTWKILISMEIIQYIIKRNGHFPNNTLPVLLYKQVLKLPDGKSEEIITEIFTDNNWSNIWTNGIYP